MNSKPVYGEQISQKWKKKLMWRHLYSLLPANQKISLVTGEGLTFYLS